MAWERGYFFMIMRHTQTLCLLLSALNSAQLCRMFSHGITIWYPIIPLEFHIIVNVYCNWPKKGTDVRRV